LADAYFIARQGARDVGMSNVTKLAADSTGLGQMFTGVLRELRGRGVATELKRRTVEYARQHGYRFIPTMNDSLDRSIWAINERLGYRREVVFVQCEKELKTEFGVRADG
jgi:mycothiol synthase